MAEASEILGDQGGAMITRVTIECLSRCGSTSVDIRPALGREAAEDYCGLLDGSSPAYVIDPRDHPESMIGKCGICRGSIRATSEEVQEQ